MKKAIATIALVALLTTGCTAMNQRTEVCTVNDKDAVSTGSGDSRRNEYRVYTEQCGTLVVKDSLVIGRFDSADLYGSLKPGSTYEMELGGYRQGALSMFPNIIDAKAL